LAFAAVDTGTLPWVNLAAALVCFVLGAAAVYTVVVTVTLVGFAADGALAGRRDPQWLRRLLAIAAMGTGALGGALAVHLLNGAAATFMAAGVIAAGLFCSSPAAGQNCEPRRLVNSAQRFLSSSESDYRTALLRGENEGRHGSPQIRENPEEENAGGILTWRDAPAIPSGVWRTNSSIVRSRGWHASEAAARSPSIDLRIREPG
jgi:hypothetical protein